jgi:hypothetical protein
MAERRFLVRIRICLPREGLDQRHSHVACWHEENCGVDGWAMAPWRMRLVLNDAASINFVDATLASAFVARRGAGYKVETPVAVFGVRDDEPAASAGGEDASDVRIVLSLAHMGCPAAT